MQIGGVIRNPEVQGLVKPLLLAIAAPNKHAKAALDILLQTVFVNTVDAPSLALIVPVIHRGLRDRSGDAKKKAARIVGNMCALINEPKARTTVSAQEFSSSQTCFSVLYPHYALLWLLSLGCCSTALLSCPHLTHITLQG